MITGRERNWRFLCAIEPGDHIVTPAAPSRSPVLIGTARDDQPYLIESVAGGGGNPHRRGVVWEPEPVDIGGAAARHLGLQVTRSTVRLITNDSLWFLAKMSSKSTCGEADLAE